MAYERTLVQIRERSFLDLLDLALLVIRRRPLALFLSALAGVLPFAGFNYWLTISGDDSTIFFCSVMLPWAEAPVATACLTTMLGGLMFGERPATGRILRTVTVALVPMVLYQIVVRGFMMTTIILYPLVPIRLGFINEVLLLERGSWTKAAGRSGVLSGGSGAELFLQWLGQLVFGFAFIVSFWFGTGAVTNALFSSELTWDEPAMADLAGLRFQCGLWLAIAFFAVARFLTYIDQRIRHEGWEIELRLRSVGHALEETHAW